MLTASTAARKKAMETEQQRERKAIEDSRNFLRSYQKQRVWNGSNRGLPASSAAPAPPKPANSATLLSQSIPVNSEVELDPSLFLVRALCLLVGSERSATPLSQRTYDYGLSRSTSRYQRDDSYLEELMRQPWFQSSQ